MSKTPNTDFDSIVTTDRPSLGAGAVTGSPTDGSGKSQGPVDFSSVTGADDLQAIEALTGTGYAKRTGTSTWALISPIPFSDLGSLPTTLAGYGITDAQPLDGDLTAIAALTGTNTLYYRSGASTWTPVAIGSGISFSGGTLSASGGGGGSPGGSDTDIQFNHSGAFDANSDLTWDYANGQFKAVGGATSGYRNVATLQSNSGQGNVVQLANLNSTSKKSQISFLQSSTLHWALGTDANENGGDDFFIYQDSRSDFSFWIRSGGIIHFPAYTTPGLIANDSSGILSTLTIGSGLTVTGSTLSAAGGGGSPGGSTNDIQFNDGSGFGAAALGNLTWDDGAKNLNVGGTAGFAAPIQINPTGTLVSYIQWNTGGTRYVIVGASHTTDGLITGTVLGDMAVRTTSKIFFSCDDGTTVHALLTQSLFSLGVPIKSANFKSSTGLQIKIGDHPSAGADTVVQAQCDDGSYGRIFQRAAGGSNNVYCGDIDAKGGELHLRANGADVLSFDSSGAVAILPLVPLTTGLTVAVATKSFPLTVDGVIVNVLCQ